MTTMQQVEAGARRHAKSAALRDLGTSACPYPAEGTGTVQAARRAWYAEYLYRRPPAVDYSGDLDALAAGDSLEDEGTQESDRVVDDAADVVLEAGWVPPVPVALLDLREAGSDRKLRAYWVRGEGATKIGWGKDGDFTSCVSHLGEYVTDAKGLCAEYHKAATGEWPGKGKKH